GRRRSSINCSPAPASLRHCALCENIAAAEASRWASPPRGRRTIPFAGSGVLCESSSSQGNPRNVSGNLQLREKVMLTMRTLAFASFLAAAIFLSGCQSAVYRAYESFGIEKRDILVNRVSDARDSQSKAK